jgi:hypothetical protein
MRGGWSLSPLITIFIALASLLTHIPCFVSNAKIKIKKYHNLNQ